MLTTEKIKVLFKVKAIYKNGEEAYIEADKITVIGPAGDETTLAVAEFSSFLKGNYTFKAYSQDVVSLNVSIEVLEEDLTSIQASNISLHHKDGQTFITFEEIVRLVNDESISYKDLFGLMDAYQRDVSYNVYYSSHPITSLDGLDPITTVKSLSGWNKEFYGISTKNKTNEALRYVIKEGEGPLGLSTGLYVNTADQEGVGFYAITSIVDGVENKTLIAGENIASISERIGQGTPVLQRIVEDTTFQYIKNAKLTYFTRWEGPQMQVLKARHLTT